MMSIGEFARAVELSVSAVRFYADRGLLAPSHTDPSTGYRYYAADQIDRGSLIRDLRVIDMSLSKIADVLEMNPEARDQAVQEHLDGLEGRLIEMRSAAHNLRRDEQGHGPTLVRSSDLAQAIRQVVVAAGTNPAEPQHMCVLVEVRDGSLRCAATDRYRLAVRDLVPIASGSAFAAVVAAAEIRRWPEVLDAGGDRTISLVGDVLSAVGGGRRLSCPVVPIMFPEYEAVLQTSASPTLSVIVDRTKVLPLLRSFGGSDPVLLTVGASALSATRDGLDRSVAAQVTQLASSPGEVWVDPSLALAIAEQAVGPELVIEIAGEHQPVTFRSADDGTYVSKLMPVVAR